jgi:hypothetical protein
MFASGFNHREPFLADSVPPHAEGRMCACVRMHPLFAFCAFVACQSCAAWRHRLLRSPVPHVWMCVYYRSTMTECPLPCLRDRLIRMCWTSPRLSHAICGAALSWSFASFRARCMVMACGVCCDLRASACASCLQRLAHLVGLRPLLAVRSELVVPPCRCL